MGTQNVSEALDAGCAKSEASSPVADRSERDAKFDAYDAELGSFLEAMELDAPIGSGSYSLKGRENVAPDANNSRSEDDMHNSTSAGKPEPSRSRKRSPEITKDKSNSSSG